MNHDDQDPMRTQQHHSYHAPPPQYHAAAQQDGPRPRRRLHDLLADAWSHRWIRILVLLCLALLAMLASDSVADLLHWLMARASASAIGPVAPLFVIELLLYVLVERRWLRRTAYAQASTIRMHAFVTFTLTGTLGTLISFGSTAEGSFDQAVQSTIVGVVLGLTVLVYDAYRALHDAQRGSHESHAGNERPNASRGRDEHSRIERPDNPPHGSSHSSQVQAVCAHPSYHGDDDVDVQQRYHGQTRFPQEHQQRMQRNGHPNDFI